MKKNGIIYFLIFISIIIYFSIIGFMLQEYSKPLTEEEKQHLVAYYENIPKKYYKDIQVKIIDIDANYLNKYLYEVNITVYNEEYNITQSFKYDERITIAGHTTYDKREGDMVKAQLCTWTIEKTNTVTDRKIVKIYHN